MDSAFDEVSSQGSSNAFRGGQQAVGFAGVRDVIQAHANILARCDLCLD
jgi:hypothetical protein